MCTPKMECENQSLYAIDFCITLSEVQMVNWEMRNLTSQQLHWRPTRTPLRLDNNFWCTLVNNQSHKLNGIF